MLCNIKSLTSRCLAGGAIAGPVFLKISSAEWSGRSESDGRLLRSGLIIIVFFANSSLIKCNV